MKLFFLACCAAAAFLAVSCKGVSDSDDEGTSNPKSTVFHLKYDANGGTGSILPSTITPGVLTEVKQGSMSRSGYSFVGWNTEKDGSGPDFQPGDTLPLSSDKIFYAHWLEPDVAEIYKKVEIGYGSGDNAGTVSGDVKLPETVEGNTVVWDIGNAAVVSNKGGYIPRQPSMKLQRQELSAKFMACGKQQSKKFELSNAMFSRTVEKETTAKIDKVSKSYTQRISYSFDGERFYIRRNRLDGFRLSNDSTESSEYSFFDSGEIYKCDYDEANATAKFALELTTAEKELNLSRQKNVELNYMTQAECIEKLDDMLNTKQIDDIQYSIFKENINSSFEPKTFAVKAYKCEDGTAKADWWINIKIGENWFPLSQEWDANEVQ